MWEQNLCLNSRIIIILQTSISIQSGLSLSPGWHVKPLCAIVKWSDKHEIVHHGSSPSPELNSIPHVWETPDLHLSMYFTQQR